MNLLAKLILSFGVFFAVACGPAGQAPIIEDIPPQQAAVNEPFSVNIIAADPDGDALTFSFASNIPELRDRANMTTSRAGGGVFRWTPRASDLTAPGEVHAIDFLVSDGGYTERLTIQVEVKAALGDDATPAFMEPLGQGTTLDLSPENRCLSLDVVVRDSDSLEVDIQQMEPVLDGMELRKTGGHAAKWSWCPNDAQIADRDRYEVRFQATDGEHDSEIKVYTIALRGSVEPPVNCTHDDFEPNDTQAEATITVPYDANPLSWSGRDLTVCGGLDYYKVEVFDGDTVTIDLDYTGISSTFDVGIKKEGTLFYKAFASRDSSGSTLVYTIDDPECVFTVGSAAPCVFLLDVWESGGTSGSYDLFVDVTF